MHWDSDEPLQEMQDEWQSAQLLTDANDILIIQSGLRHVAWEEIEKLPRTIEALEIEIVFSHFSSEEKFLISNDSSDTKMNYRDVGIICSCLKAE